MNQRKYFTKTRVQTKVAIVAAALAIFCIAMPAFGQQTPQSGSAPAPQAFDCNAPGAECLTGCVPANKAKADTPSSAICPAAPQEVSEPGVAGYDPAPDRLSAQDPVAPRSTVDTLAEIKKAGKLRVGVSMIVPWAMHDKDGKLIGFEIDVAKKIARDLGVEVEFYPDELRYLIPDLKDNRFDVIVSGFSISTNRAMQVNFSQPYNYVDVTFAANKEMESKLKTLGDFNSPDVTIGVLDTSTAVDIASNAFPNAQLRTYPESADIFTDLLDGKIAGAVADSPRPEIIAKLFPDKVDIPSTKVLARFPAAFAVRRGDMDFVNYLNSWIEARTVNKWLENRRNYWFSTTDWEKRL
ncbi:MAG TPA: transporter substrate-binding domain-containing protein [Candidatus Acidoferrales bacterium]